MAIGPIDYSIDTGNPFQGALQGFQSGFGIGNAIQQRQAQLAQQQAQQAAAQQMNAELSAVAANPNASGADYAGLMTRYPQLSENLKRGWDVLNDAQKQEKLNQSSQVYAALQAGKPQIAKDYLQTLSDAATNSGDAKMAAGLNGLIKMIDIDPNSAKASLGMMITAQAGPDKFAEAFGKFGTEQRAQEAAPFVQREAVAKAQSAEEKAKTDAITAKYADSNAVQDLLKKKWDVNKIISDINIDKENARIRAMEASLKHQDNDLKRQELAMKIDEAKTKRDERINERAAEVESARSMMDNMLNTADRILATPKDVIGSAAGPISARVPTLSQDTADLEELVSTLGSQSFIAQIPNIKGMGSLSNDEGKKLEAALQNFSLRQSPERLVANVKEAQRLILKARKNMATRYGIPETGPDRPDAPQQSADFGGGAAAPTQPGTQQRNIVVDF
jgi:hypothetical protein